MNTKENESTHLTSLLKRAIDTYGEDAQILMTIEECSELINAITKLYRGRVDEKAITTELADVYIMVQQMALIFGEDDFKKEVEYKLNRLEERLNKHGRKEK